jgi:hypothetical protein
MTQRAPVASFPAPQPNQPSAEQKMTYELFSQRHPRRDDAFPPNPPQRTLPAQLCRNIATIFTETFGMYYDGELGIGHEPVETTRLWLEFERCMLRESDEYALFAQQNNNVKANRRICAFTQQATDKGVIDLLDVGIAVITQLAAPLQQKSLFDWEGWNVRLSAKDAIDELDARLLKHGTIYRIVDNALVISTEEVTHELAVAPALHCLHGPGFGGARSEFHEALKAYRDGKYDQTLVKANHAFESTMKVIAKKMGWKYEETATAKKLIDVMTANGLLPPMRESAMKALASMLESDVPTMRNKMPSAGHGRGDRTEAIPEPIATYAMTASAANIRLLVESFRLKRT